MASAASPSWPQKLEDAISSSSVGGDRESATGVSSAWRRAVCLTGLIAFTMAAGLTANPLALQCRVLAACLMRAFIIIACYCATAKGSVAPVRQILRSNSAKNYLSAIRVQHWHKCTYVAKLYVPEGSSPGGNQLTLWHQLEPTTKYANSHACHLWACGAGTVCFKPLTLNRLYCRTVPGPGWL